MEDTTTGQVDARPPSAGFDPRIRALGRDVLLRVLSDMYVSRCVERTLLDAAARGEVPGPLHTSIGQEAVPATLARVMTPEDQVVGNHRSHHHLVVQSLLHTLAPDWDPIDDGLRGTSAAQAALTSTFAEILGRPSGINHGLGGSMHLRNEAAGFVGSSAIVGGGMPLAAGVALAARSGVGCVVAYIGDGAVNQGTFHETCNLAGLLGLRLLVVVENNGYAESTRPDEASAVALLASKAAVHGLAASVADGADVPGLHAAFAGALEHMRRGDGPALLEVTTYRELDHTGPNPGSNLGYRDADEETGWARRQPVAVLPERLVDAGLATWRECEQVRAGAAALVAAAFDGVRPAEAAIPLDTTALLRDVRPRTVRAAPRRVEATPASRWTFRHAIARGLAHALETRDDVVFLGEEVGKPGGLLAQEKQLNPALLGSRILDMPISEASFVGMACGAAMSGLRPIVELMYGSFALIAADQLFNHIGTVRALYGDTAEAPVIVRVKVPIGLGYGPQHGLNPVALFSSFPGWRVHAPATPADYLGVLNAALDGHDPVLLCEFSSLYDEVFEVSPDSLDEPGSLAGGQIARAGSDVSIVTYGLGVAWALTAVDQLACHGVSAEVVDLRALDRLSLDVDLVERSLGHCGRAVFVEPAARSQTIAPTIVSELVTRGVPLPRIAVLACADVYPVARELEQQAIATPQSIVDSALELVHRPPSLSAIG